LTGHALLGTGRVLDLGSGAGFPGLPLAIANPGMQFVLCDRSDRRARFLSHAARALGLNNVEVWARPLERTQDDTERSFDTLITRAVMPTEDVVALARGYVVKGGQVLVFESTHLLEGDIDEVSDYQPAFGSETDPTEYTRHQISVPGLTTTHTIIEVKLK
jgi:16S rRNA (guanine527-N7)-methyltransferase